MHLVLVVPWSRAAAYCAITLLSLFSRSLSATSSAQRVDSGLQEQVGRRRALILVARAALAQVAGATLASHHRHGLLHPLTRRLGRPLERSRQLAAVVLRARERFHRGRQGVAHRLVARL